MWYSIPQTLVIVVSLDSQLLNSGNLPASISIPPPSTGLGNSIIGPSHAFQLAQLEVTSFCCLMSNVLNTVVSYVTWLFCCFRHQFKLDPGYSILSRAKFYFMFFLRGFCQFLHIILYLNLCSNLELYFRSSRGLIKHILCKGSISNW